jgi:hypothetical protein
MDQLELKADLPTGATVNGSGYVGEPPGVRPGDPGVPSQLGPADLADVDWETTRYLAAATQLDLQYARQVVRRVIGEPIRAVAPAAGADIVVVTQWALAALRRAAVRDAVLVWLLVVGTIAVVMSRSWIAVVVVLAGAVVAVAYERWVRDQQIITRKMLRGRFRASLAPHAASPRIQRRLAVVARQQYGNVVVFPKQKAFMGSGQRVIHSRVLVQVALGKKGKNGKRKIPVPFTNAELLSALEQALKMMGFPHLRVGQRLYVNGTHVAANSRILPDPLAPPVAKVPADMLDEGCARPTADARTYLCAEIPGWKGQLVVTLFARAVQANGSLQFEWRFQVLPPLQDRFLDIDRRFESRPAMQCLQAAGTGVKLAIPSLLQSPVRLWRYAMTPVDDWRRQRRQAYAIEHGYVFNYGSMKSIREGAVGNDRLHYFLAQDELTFILLAEHTILRALGSFLDAHKIDMEQFNEQEKTYITKISNYNVNDFRAENVAVGGKASAGAGKSAGGAGSGK